MGRAGDRLVALFSFVPSRRSRSALMRMKRSKLPADDLLELYATPRRCRNNRSHPCI